METKTTPPPLNVCTEDFPDYYFGMLLYYDLDGTDNCRWVVYNGDKKVRCPTRRDALDYIMSAAKNTSETGARLILDARMSLNRAINALDKAASYETGTQRLLLERLTVKIKPVLVELDNILTLTTIHYDEETNQHQARR